MLTLLLTSAARRIGPNDTSRALPPMIELDYNLNRNENAAIDYDLTSYSRH